MILNAGWAVRKDVSHWGRFTSGLSLQGSEAEYRALQRLNRLLLKAIEITSIRRAWEEVKDDPVG